MLRWPSFGDLLFERHREVWARSSAGTRFPRSVPVGMPKIPDMMLDSVFYLYESEEDAKAGIGFGGTGFLVFIPSKVSPEGGYVYGITNWHVACGDGYSVVRLNTLAGDTDIFPFELHEWTFDPRYDIAVKALPIDVSTHRLSVIDASTFMTPEIQDRCRIGLGDDVFMLGRFVDHDGGQSNRPTARFGNISLMPSPIVQPNGKTADSYCVDLHSRSGYSGSPVFVYRVPGDDLELMANRIMGREVPRSVSFLALLGIHWGQFPERWRIEDGGVIADEASGPLIREGQYVKGLSGMTCVLPAACITEVLNMPSLREPREKTERELAARLRQSGAVPPDAESATKPEENPDHREDFTALLGEAAKPKPKGGRT